MSAEHLISWEEAVIRLRQDPEMAGLVRDCYFDDPLHEAAERFYASAEWVATRDSLSIITKGRCLDIGAGRGISTYAFARDGWDVTAVEPDPSAIVGSMAVRSLLKASGFRAEVVDAPAEELPFDNGSFDLVYMRQALHHSGDLLKSCAEVLRVLRPGAIFMAAREHVISSVCDLPVFQRSHPLHWLYGMEMAYTLPQYRNALRASGLELLRAYGPYDSDINLHPSTRAALRAKMERRLRVALPDAVFGLSAKLMSVLDTTPGRLYTFIARRP